MKCQRVDGKIPEIGAHRVYGSLPGIFESSLVVEIDITGAAAVAAVIGSLTACSD